MAYEMVMPYHLHMPSYFLETFTEYPERDCRLIYIKPADLIYISRPLFTICYNGYFRS